MKVTVFAKEKTFEFSGATVFIDDGFVHVKMPDRTVSFRVEVIEVLEQEKDDS